MGWLYAQIFLTDKDWLWLTELNLLSREKSVRVLYNLKGLKK